MLKTCLVSLVMATASAPFHHSPFKFLKNNDKGVVFWAGEVIGEPNPIGRPPKCVAPVKEGYLSEGVKTWITMNLHVECEKADNFNSDTIRKNWHNGIKSAK